MTALELKPCPFCGGDAVALTGPVKTLWGVTCLRCACWRDDRADTADEAVAAWNRRADLAAVQPAQVRVKPLVWSDRFGPNPECSYDHITADSALGLYRVEWKGWKDFDPPTVCCGGAFIGCYNTIQSAKSAAQADYEARILAALEPHPDPRDEVIKGLGPIADLLPDAVAAAEKAMRKYPQPNYVISKWAEETGEVTKDLIHMAEGRQTVEKLRGEIVQSLAMLHRLLVEGDQVHGLPPIAAALAAAKVVQP